jgi:TRAP-type uncharacterized transport system substrate-binding protein
MSFADKRLVFGGAGPGTPWGTLGQITARALEPEGYQVRVEPGASRGRCPGLVSAGQVDFGATQMLLVRWAYAGEHRFKAEGALPRLRAIATIMFPAWLGVAARWETGITELSQVAEQRLPVRVLGGTGELFQPVLAYYGLSRDLIEAWGGRFLPSLATTPGPQYVVTPYVRTGEVDLILDNVYAAYTPEAAAFVEASILLNLRFLALPDALIERICDAYGGVPGVIPYRLLRGVDAPTKSVYRPWQLIFGRDDMPDEFAYALARAYDAHRDLFRQSHIPYSWDPAEVAQTHGIPLHPGAERFYRERGYLNAPPARLRSRC